jgi:hypothetical protein
MINLRCVSQPQFPEGFVEGAVGDLWEPWMREADQLLDDDQLLNVVYEALVRRAPKSRTFGRLGVPAEIVVRMLVLKHLRNWSFDELEREVRPNLLYREFTRVAAGKVPDAKTLGSQARALGPEAIKRIHQRVVALAVENKVVQGRKMRVDTTVVETNIHYPTDSSLLDDGNRMLTRLMKKVRTLAGAVGAKLRDRSRSVKLRVLDIARAARSKVPQSREKLKQAWQTAGFNGSGGGTRQTLLQRDRRWGEAILRLHATSRAGGPAPRDRHHGAARSTGDQANQSTVIQRRYSCRRQALQYLRAGNGNHSKRQGGETE